MKGTDASLRLGNMGVSTVGNSKGMKAWIVVEEEEYNKKEV